MGGGKDPRGKKARGGEPPSPLRVLEEGERFMTSQKGGTDQAGEDKEKQAGVGIPRGTSAHLG